MSTPELKKKKQMREAAATKSATSAAVESEKAEVEHIKTITAKAKAYEVEYVALEKASTENRRSAKADNSIYVASEGKLVFVIRIRGIIGISPKVKKILQLFRLRQINNACFVKMNAATEKMLRLIEPFISYGYPSLKSVRDIIYKRGYGKVSGQRIPLSTNVIIKSSLGDRGIECIEDIVHEIYTVGPEFKVVSNFLWPFKMNSPSHGVRGKKLNHHNEGGSCGMSGDKINIMIKKML